MSLSKMLIPLMNPGADMQSVEEESSGLSMLVEGHPTRRGTDDAVGLLPAELLFPLGQKNPYSVSA